MNELKHLMPETALVIKKLAEIELLEQFTFVGGSALAVYLSHRFSEDIDLFTWNKELDSLHIKQTIEEAEFKTVRIVNLSKRQVDLIIDGLSLF